MVNTPSFGACRPVVSCLLKYNPRYTNNMSPYTKSDSQSISWSEYVKVLETLYQNVHKLLEEQKLQVRVVIPIMRGGAIPAQYLGYKLGVLRYAPIQYKYFKQGDEYKIKKIGETKLEADFLIKDGETILVVENNHCFGTTAKAVVEESKKSYPNSKIVYAATYLDYTHRNSVPADFIAYGTYTNETNGASKEEVAQMGLSNKFSLYPWEKIDEELAAVNSQPFDYGLN